METVADRTEGVVGDAVGLKCTISGTGNLKIVESPTLAPSADFRVFDPRVEEKASGTKPRSYTKTWSYVVTPLSTGSLTLPAMTFSYFDPEAGAYRTLSSPAARLTVTLGTPAGGGETGPAAAAGRHEVQSLQRDIRFLKTLDGPLERARSPLYARWWIWALLAAALAAQPAAWFLHRQGGLAALRPGGARGGPRRRALASLARAAAPGVDPAAAAAAVSQALVGFIAERCGITAGGLTYEEMELELGRRGGGTGTLSELHALLELCDLGRFAPEARREGAGQDLLSRAKALVERLDAELGRAA